MRTFGQAYDYALKAYINTGTIQYIIYNHVRCKYRVSKQLRYSINEELANFVNSII